jgi:mono/diheme cytochrome c family protein
MPWLHGLRLLMSGSVAAGGIALASTLGDDAQRALGREVFIETAQPPCGVCHTLGDAGTVGTTGPNLDEQKPDLDIVRLTVTEGAGVMPAYGELLDEAQIEAVAAYVSSVAGKEN